jgi:hypothetical protein
LVHFKGTKYNKHGWKKESIVQILEKMKDEEKLEEVRKGKLKNANGETGMLNERKGKLKLKVEKERLSI